MAIDVAKNGDMRATQTYPAAFLFIPPFSRRVIARRREGGGTRISHRNIRYISGMFDLEKWLSVGLGDHFGFF